MKKIAVLLAVLFLLVDAAAFFVWWTHPKGARKMGYSGRLPFEIPFKLPYALATGPANKDASAAGEEQAAKPLPASVTKTYDEKSPYPGKDERRSAPSAAPSGSASSEAGPRGAPAGDAAPAPKKRPRRRKRRRPKKEESTGLLDDSFGEL